MKRLVLTSLCVAATLSGCAAYPELSGPAVLQATGTPDRAEMEAVLVEASRLQGTYAVGYSKSAAIADFSQLPIVGAAAAAAWILLDNKTGAANVAAKIGIGAGAYAATRGQLSAAGLPEAYIAGHGALTCVMTEGSLFAGTGAELRHKNLGTGLQTLADTIGTLESDLVVMPADRVNADATALLIATRVLARQAITQARGIEATSLTQDGAYAESARVFRNAVAAVSVRVASRGRVRPAIDFATLRDSFAAAPKTATTVKAATPLSGNAFVESPQAEPDDSAQALILRITQETNALITASAVTSASTPHYVDSLVHATACPNQIT